MKKTILTFGLFSLMMVLTSFTSAEIGNQGAPQSRVSDIGNQGAPQSRISDIGNQGAPQSR